MKPLIIIAHAGLDRKIAEEECLKAIGEHEFSIVHFIDFEIVNAKLSELYDLPFEQLALEQQRKFKEKVEPLLQTNPDAVVAYFGLAPIPLAFHLGVLLNGFPNCTYFQFHHERKTWYEKIDPPKDYSFGLAEIELPSKVEKGKGDIFIRVSTSYRIEPQHTYEVASNPTNEFDLRLVNPHVDGVSNQDQLNLVVNRFQDVLAVCSNQLPDRDKIHIFISATTGIAFALGTKINPTVYPFVQTYQFSRDQTPKYKEAILISKKTEQAVAFSEEQKALAAEMRVKWNREITERIRPFIKTNQGVFENWFYHIIQNDASLKDCLNGAWKSLPDLGKTSLLNDTIDLNATTVNNGFKYDSANSKWQIDDGMCISLKKRLEKYSNVDSIKAGRLFFFHEGLHYSQDGHSLTEEIATGIGRFPKVIGEADYQADVWALLYEYRFSLVHNQSNVEPNIKKFFLDTIDTAVETMWSFVDMGFELTEIQIRSMNRFLNWYWQWVRIERLPGNGTLKEIILILFDKPTIEFAGAEIITLDKQRTCYKLSAKPISNYELAIFHKNKVHRFSPTRITRIVEGFRELNGGKIKEGLRSFLVTLE